MAKATVYGPKGEDDIKEYGAFTMSSDFSKYGAIADGEYMVNWDEKGKSEFLKSHWAINNRKPVNCLGGVNPAPNGYSNTQKSGIFIHRSNNDGSMNPIGKDGIIHPASTGCPIIVPSRNGENGWTEFNLQLNGVKSFKLWLNRN